MDRIRINAVKKYNKNLTNFLSEDEASISKIRDVFLRLKGATPAFNIAISEKDAEFNDSVLQYLESIREKKRASFYQISPGAPSFSFLLDKAYAKYINANTYLMDKEIAQEFLIYALDIKNAEFKLNTQIIRAMKLRESIKKKNPNFIPGRSPLAQNLLAPEVLAAVSQTTKFRKTDDLTVRSLFETNELLDVGVLQASWHSFL